MQRRNREDVSDVIVVPSSNENGVNGGESAANEGVNVKESMDATTQDTTLCSFDTTTSSFIENINSFCASIQVDGSFGSSFGSVNGTGANPTSVNCNAEGMLTSATGRVETC